DLDASRDGGEPLAHADQSKTRRRACLVEPHPVVHDSHDEPAAVSADDDRGTLRLAVPDNVLQGFLRNAVQAQRHVAGETLRNPAALAADADPSSVADIGA